MPQLQEQNPDSSSLLHSMRAETKKIKKQRPACILIKRALSFVRIATFSIHSNIVSNPSRTCEEKSCQRMSSSGLVSFKTMNIEISVIYRFGT
jgi:hypothetical protein